MKIISCNDINTLRVREFNKIFNFYIINNFYPDFGFFFAKNFGKPFEEEFKKIIKCKKMIKNVKIVYNISIKNKKY